MRPTCRTALLLACTLLLAAVPAVPARADKPRGLHAGAVAMDITPEKFPISVNGNMQDIQAKGAHDRLHARCLVLDDGRTRLALVVVDSCMVPREVVDDARARAHKRTAIPPDHILISATHSHTCPTLTGVFQSEPDLPYRDFLAGRIAEGLARAVQQLEPARAGWAVARDPTQVFNRRWKMKPGALDADPFGRTTDTVKMNPGYAHPGLVEPAGPTDPDVTILSVQARGGRPIALFANYSLHYVGGVPALSADYFGAFAERIRTLLDADHVQPPFVGVLSNGTSGDVNNINFAGTAPGPKAPAEQMRLVADSVARAALKAHATIDHRHDLTLAAAARDVTLAVRKPDKADLDRAREILAKAPTPLRTLPEIYARETVLLDKYPGTVPLHLQAFRIGGLGVAAIPCEVFTEIGLDLKKRSPLKPTCTVELANGYNGYLPTPAQHKLGGYETWWARSSYLETGASDTITATVLDLLSAVAPR